MARGIASGAHAAAATLLASYWSPWNLWTMVPDVYTISVSSRLPGGTESMPPSL
jgi:hypothetical protein